MNGSKPLAIDHLIALQRTLEARIAGTTGTAAAILELGQAVLDFASSEEEAFFPLLPLLDPAARAELAADHDELREDLQLLEWLVSASPDSPDIPPLTAALARRMHAHVTRDGRLLAQAFRLAGHADRRGAP
jgi:hypothetical protein